MLLLDTQRLFLDKSIKQVKIITQELVTIQKKPNIFKKEAVAIKHTKILTKLSKPIQ